MCDFRLQTYFRAILAGPAGCGKTTFCLNLLKYKDDMFSSPPAYVVYFYRVWQPLFAEMKKKNYVDEFREGVPTMEYLDGLSVYEDKGGSVCIIDDQIQNVNSELAEIFQVGSRHKAINLILMTQNLFSKNKYFRDISLNATYIVIFKNPRDGSIITNFAKQFSPGNARAVRDIYQKVTSDAYGYLFCDFDQRMSSALRLRTNIFPHEGGMRVFTINAK